MPARVQFTEVRVSPTAYRELGARERSWPLGDHPSELEFAPKQEGDSKLPSLAVSATIMWVSLLLSACLGRPWASVWMP